MRNGDKRSDQRSLLQRASIEVGSILFLFYSNLLMGEFERNNRHGKTLLTALADIVTRENLIIAVVSAIGGFMLFESLRRVTKNRGPD